MFGRNVFGTTAQQELSSKELALVSAEDYASILPLSREGE